MKYDLIVREIPKTFSDSELEYMLSLLEDEKKDRIKRKGLDNRNAIQTLYSNMLVKEKIAEKLYTQAKNIKFLFNKNSKPYINNDKLWFNISHSDEMVAVVLSDSPVGVDVEKNFKFNSKLAKKICSDYEMKLLERCSNKDSLLTKLWTIKESYLKAIGEGITIKISDVICNPDENIVTHHGKKAPFFTKCLNEYTVTVCQL